jgi:lipoprotein-anchoring transpeptidase ErfK/SrfK
MGKRRRLNRIVGAAGFFLLGGTTAAALSHGDGRKQATAAPAPQVALAQTSSSRVTLTEASVRQALAAGLIDRPIKSILNVPSRMSYGDYRWDEKGVPAGPTWIRVDLKSQLLSVFRAGHEIGTAVILYGADSVPTPIGSFPIQAKLKDHRSATYDAPMPYTLRLTSDGVSIHASDVRWGYATHGCIGVPAAFAAKLFASVKVGDEVLIVGGTAAPQRNRLS